MNYTRVALALASCLLLAGCITLSVNGQVVGTDETFTGTATGDLDDAGTLEITSNKGVTCKGNFVYTTPRKGEGTFTCSDGRAGAFSFVSTGMRGTGSGDLGDKKFIFTFG